MKAVGGGIFKVIMPVALSGGNDRRLEYYAKMIEELQAELNIEKFMHREFTKPEVLN